MSGQRHDGTVEWLIGSDPEATIVVANPAVSRRHCLLKHTTVGFVLEDLGSTNGTFVNGNRIAGPTRVSPADTITLGRQHPMPWPPQPRAQAPKSMPMQSSKGMTMRALRIGRDP